MSFITLRDAAQAKMRAPEGYPLTEVLPLPTVTWTGTRPTYGAVSEGEVVQLIRAELKQFSPKKIIIVTGACRGIDALAAEFAHRLGFWVHTVVPANRGVLDEHWANYVTTYEIMPEGSTYRDRNKRMIKRTSQQVIAVCKYPEHDSRSIRSGSWMTVRIARYKQIPVTEIVLNPKGGAS